MPYDLIRAQLGQSNLNYSVETLKQTDIVEYMVLEAAGCLLPLQGTKLKTLFKPNFTSNYIFEDNKPRSGIELGLKNIEINLIDHPTRHLEAKTKFVSKVNSIRTVFKDSVYDDDHRYYNYHDTFYSVILLDEDIKQAIKSSSLYIAAGDLSNFDFYELLGLRDKIGLYKIDDPLISPIVDTLAEKITTVMQNNFEEEYKLELVFSEKKTKFNQLLAKLEVKINKLKDKGNIESKLYNENYSEVAAAAHCLQYDLGEAREKFFYTKLSQESISEFEQECNQAIGIARTEFLKFRGGIAWYYDMYPILKGISIICRAIVGILAGLTAFPALAAGYLAPQGYFATFFSTKTDSIYELDAFQEELPQFTASPSNL